MQRFRFNLEKILELRVYDERQAELRLAEATGLCNSLHRKIEECDRRQRKAFARRGTIGKDISAFLQVEYFSRRMSQDIERLIRETEEAEKVRRQRQQEFLEFSRKRKILDKLKERKQNLYYREQMKAEQKNLDDISSSMYIRKMEGL